MIAHPRRTLVRAVVLGMLLALGATPVQAAVPDENAPYCEQSNPLADPLDVPAEGAARPHVPGVTDTPLVVHGVATRVLQAGNRNAPEAAVFLHGNLGSGYDWVRYVHAVSARTGMRALALDLPGWGQASKSRERRYTLDFLSSYLTDVLDALHVERAHLVVHDLSGPWTLNWTISHPERLSSIVLINTGVGEGYDWHPVAKMWRTPGVGEATMATQTRESNRAALQHGQYKPLPAEFTNRVYDDFGRLTRCAILDAYRSIGDISALGTYQISQLRPLNKPALILWGRHDPFIPVENADKQRKAFADARIVILEESAHWPYVDEPQRVEDEIVCFLSRQRLSRC